VSLVPGPFTHHRPRKGKPRGFHNGEVDARAVGVVVDTHRLVRRAMNQLTNGEPDEQARTSGITLERAA